MLKQKFPEIIYWYNWYNKCNIFTSLDEIDHDYINSCKIFIFF